jgi:hypothetical protein
MQMTFASSGVARRLINDTELHLVAQKGVIDDQGQQIDVVSSACFCGYQQWIQVMHARQKQVKAQNQKIN